MVFGKEEIRGKERKTQVSWQRVDELPKAESAKEAVLATRLVLVQTTLYLPIARNHSLARVILNEPLIVILAIPDISWMEII